MRAMRVGLKGGVVVSALAGASVFAFTVPVAQADPLVQGDVCNPEIDDGCPQALIGVLSIEKHVDGGTEPTAGFDLVATSRTYGVSVDGTDDNGIFPSSDDVATVLDLLYEAPLNGGAPAPAVFIGEVLRDGFVFDGVSCTGDVSESWYEFIPGADPADDQVGLEVQLSPNLDGELQNENGLALLNGFLTAECAVKNLSATIELTKTVSPASVAPGANVVFTITATNTGESTLYDGVLEDVLPSGMTFVSAVGGAGVTCDDTAPIRCDLDAVAPGGAHTATVTATVGAGVADASTLTNAASVEALAPRWTPDLCIFDRSEDVLTFGLAAVDERISGEECDAPAFVVSDEATATVTAVVPTTSTTSTTTTTVAPTTTALGVQPPAPTTLPPLTGILPETGAGDSNLPIIPMSALVLGGLLLLVRRRRPGQA